MSYYIYDYDDFMAKKPTHLGTVYGEVEIYEHPVHGDEAAVLGVDHKRKLVWNTTFFDPDTEQGDAEHILEMYQELTESPLFRDRVHTKRHYTDYELVHAALIGQHAQVPEWRQMRLPDLTIATVSNEDFEQAHQQLYGEH